MKGACLWHEEHCYKNPQNKHACYKECRFLTDSTITIPLTSYEYGAPDERKQKTKHCSFFNKTLISFRAAGKKLPEKYPETFEDAIKMPLVCKEYKQLTIEEQIQKYS